MDCGWKKIWGDFFYGKDSQKMENNVNVFESKKLNKNWCLEYNLNIQVGTLAQMFI
jgi:hypothetical protein